jgi:predicted Zn-dependent peptidase
LAGSQKKVSLLKKLKKKILEQIELVKKGEFPEWLMEAVITDFKLRKTKELENNSTRADAMLNAFVNDRNWRSHVNTIERLSKITKSQISEFAMKNFSRNNYAVAYKRTAEDSVVKVDKPEITPVELDRDNSSPFVQEIMKATPKEIQPKFLDYGTDIVKSTLKSGIQLLYNKNTENRLFELYYKFDMGSNNNKLFPVAVKYIPYLSTKEMKAAQIKQELYRLGCSFNVFCDNENIWVSLTGLNDNFQQSVQLFEKMLAEPVVEETVLKNMVADIMKERNDNKLQKRIILNRAMTNYARYGEENPFTNVLKNEELSKLTTEEIRKTIAGLSSYQHKVLYYGPRENEEIRNILMKEHTVPATLTPVPVGRTFEEKELARAVYVVDYDMKQAEIVMLSNGGKFIRDKVPVITLYNSYFGGGMSSILFQDLRESKALAYSTYSRYNQPNKLHKSYYNLSYIGSQADKLSEAMKGLTDLLNDMPKAPGSFAAAKEMLLQEMRTQRVTKSGILFNYLEAEELGLANDIRKDIFDQVQKFEFEDIKTFHEQTISKKPATVLVLGKKDNLDLKILEQYGPVKFLTLEQVFGY